MTLDEFIRVLNTHGCRPRKSGGGYVARCPAHEDKEPSLSVKEGNKGRVIKCHAGCSTENILAALSLSVSDLFDGPSDDFESRIVETYDYTDETGELLFQALRLLPIGGGRKTFQQRRPDGSGGWARNLDGVRRVLYRLPAVHAAVSARKAIWIAEGEKDVHSLERLGFVATTAPMGAGKWRDEYTDSLRGCPAALVVCDCDGSEQKPKGRQHARAVCASLYKQKIPCRLIDLAPDRDDGYDVTDFALQHGDNTRAELERLAKLAPWWPQAEPPKLEVVSFGDFASAVGDYDDSLDYVGALVRGGERLHVLGPIGHGKTTFMAEALAAAALGRDFLGFRGKGGLRVLYVELGDMTPHEVRTAFIAAGFDPRHAHLDLALLPDGLEIDRSEQDRRRLESVFASYDIVAIDPWYKLLGEEQADGMRNARVVTSFLDGLRDRYPKTATMIGFHTHEPQQGRQLRGVGSASGFKVFQKGANCAVIFERIAGDRSRVLWAKTRNPRLPKMYEAWEVEWQRGHGFRRVDGETPGQQQLAA